MQHELKWLQASPSVRLETEKKVPPAFYFAKQMLNVCLKNPTMLS